MCTVALPDDNHLSRYCKPSAIGRDGLPLAAAFELRSGEDYLSVNWLECLGAPDLDAAIECIRNVFRTKGYRLKPSGRFAALNAGAVKTAVSEHVEGAVRIEHLPLDDDRSHRGVFGYTADDLAAAVAIRELVSRESVHPAAADQPTPLAVTPGT